MLKEVVTSQGEILEVRGFNSKFRSVTDLKDFKDDEISSLPSLTTTDGYEPLEQIFARCQRGELILQRRDAYYSSKSSDELLNEDMYDIEDMTDVDDIIDNMVQPSQTVEKAPSSTQQVEEAVYSDSEADKSNSPAS